MEEELKGKDIIDWVKKNRYFVLLLGILLFAFILRMHYIDVNQAVWWDEADYLSLGKHYGLGTPEVAAPWRARVIPMVWGLFYFLGAGEYFIRLLEILVSVAGVYLTYLVGKQLYGKKVGLIAAFGLSTLWIHLFWTARISLGVYGLTIWLLAVYLFWDSYIENGKTWKLIVAGALMGIGPFIYDALGFLLLFMGLFLLITDRFKFFKSKKFWLAVLALILFVGIFGTYHYMEFGSPYPRFDRILDTGGFLKEVPVGEIVKESASSGFVFDSFLRNWVEFPNYLTWPFFAMFVIGLYSFLNLFLGLDILIKGKSKKLKRDFFVFLWIFVILLVFSIYIAFPSLGTYFEPRYLFPMFPAVFMVMGKGVMYFYNFIKKYNKELALVLVLLVLAGGAYSQISFADHTIDAGTKGFVKEPEAGKWLKQNSNFEDFLITCSQDVPLIYYSERPMKHYGKNFTENDQTISEFKPKYLILDAYHWDCNTEYPLSQPDIFKPVQAFFVDEAKTQPVIIIFEIDYSKFN